MIANREILHSAADCGNDTSPLVTIDAGIRHLEMVVAGLQIGVTDSGGGDIDQHFVGPRRIEFKPEDARLLFCHRRGNAHPKFLS